MSSFDISRIMEATSSCCPSSPSCCSCSPPSSSSPPSPPLLLSSSSHSSLSTHDAKYPIARPLPPLPPLPSKSCSHRPCSHSHSRTSTTTTTVNNTSSPRASTGGSNITQSTTATTRSQHTSSHSYYRSAPAVSSLHNNQCQQQQRHHQNSSVLHHRPPSFSSFSSSFASSSFKHSPSPITRTISSSSNLNLQIGNLRPSEHYQHQQQMEEGEGRQSNPQHQLERQQHQHREQKHEQQQPHRQQHSASSIPIPSSPPPPFSSAMASSSSTTMSLPSPFPSSFLSTLHPLPPLPCPPLPHPSSLSSSSSSSTSPSPSSPSPSSPSPPPSSSTTSPPPTEELSLTLDQHHHRQRQHHRLLHPPQPQPPPPLLHQHHQQQSSSYKPPLITRVPLSQQSGSIDSSSSSSPGPAAASTEYHQGRHVQDTIAAFSRLTMKNSPNSSTNQQHSNTYRKNNNNKSPAITPLLTISSPPVVALAIVATSTSTSTSSSTSMSPASSSSFSQLPSVSPSSTSPTSSDISSSSLLLASCSPAATLPASPSSSCTKTTTTAGTAQSTSRAPAAAGPEQIGRRGSGTSAASGAAGGVVASGKQQPSISFSQSTTSANLPASITPSALIGMKKPLPPAVLTNYVVGGSIGGRRGSGGPGSATTPCSATGSPSDLYPLVGRDALLGYGSLSAAALTTAAAAAGDCNGNSHGGAITITGIDAVEPQKLRPMSSMENVEFAWSPTATAMPGSPTTATATTTTEADGRAVASSRSGYDTSFSSPSPFTTTTAATTAATTTTTTAAAAVMSLGRHNNNNNSDNISCSSSPSHPAGSCGSYPTESSCVSKISSNNRNRQNSDQGTVATAGRASLDQNSIHPLQLDPDLATTTEEDEEEEDEEDEEQDIEVEMKGEVAATLTNDEQGATPTTTTALSTALPLSTVTPVSMELATTSSFSEEAGYAGAASSSGMNQDLPTIPQPQQHVVRKKTSFAAKLRKVFNNSKALPRTPQDTPAASSTVSQQYQQEDIISLLSSDDLFGIRQVATSVGGGGGVSTHAEAMGLMDQQQHRGSVSSASSVDTIEVHPHSNSPFLNRRGSNQTETPSTSPEATPCGSPTDMSNLNTVMSVASNQQPGGSGVVVVVGPLPSAGPREMDPDNTQHRHPLSGSEYSSESSSTLDIENSVSALAVGMPHVVANLPTNQTAADLASALQPPPLPAKTTTPTRTVKKRLSFASISSFFSPRNTSNNATAQQEARAKQQRASSVPHVENPLVTVGRQIAGFQRRHSLNDLHDNKAAGASKISRVGVNPWEKDSNAPLSPTTTAAGAACVGQGGAATATAAPASSAHPASQQGIPKPAKKLSLNSVFNKGLRKKKKSTAGKPDSPLPAKPLRSALANRSKITPPGSDPAIQQHQAPKVHLVHRSSVVVAGRRRSASIRSQSSSHRRHHRLSHHQHQHQHGHHHHHGHSNHQHTDPFARLAEANHALATLNRRATDDQTGNALLRLQQQQQQQYQVGEFSTSQEEFEFCASPSSYDSTSGGLPPLDTEGLQYHHNNKSQEGLPISPTRPTTGDSGAPLDPSGSTAFSTPPTPRVLPNVATKQGDGSEQNLDAHSITFNRSQYIHQRSALSTLSPSSSCCSYSSSSASSDGVEGSSIRSTSDDVESCSSSSCSSKQESPVAPESAAGTTGTSTGSVSGSGSESVAGSLSSRRNSADHGAVFNPLLPASAARVSVNRIAMESQLQAHNNYSGGSDSSSCNDGSVAKSIDSVAVLHDQHQNNNSLIGAGEESASTMSSSSTEVSSTTSSSSTSTDSPTKKNATVTIMNTVAEDVVSEEEAMMHAQLAYIQQQQQQYLVQQQQQHHHQQQYQQQLHQQQQMQQEHHHHHHHVHYLPQDYHHHHHSHSHHNHPHHYHSHSHHAHNQQAGYDPIPSEPHHHQPYYYPHPSLFPPRPPRQLQFSTEEPLVYPTWTPEQYDRTSDAYITASRLTPAMANKIKLELNQFKSQEMLVHEESRVYTHFFI